eukprot:s326_g43.t1
MSEPPNKKQRTGVEDASKTSEGSRVLAVLGLGNPGGSCKRERHSLGARVAAALVQEHKACSSPERKENKDLDGAVWLCGEKFQAQVLVLEPQRPINDNGPQLHSALPLGSIRFREKGSSGGHKGLEGIEAAFDCKQNYHRLRLGIGGKNLKEFVTGTFTEEEETLIEPVLTAAVSAVEAWLKLGPEASQKIMSIVNAPTFTKDPSALKR